MTDQQTLTKKPENAPPACDSNESGNALDKGEVDSLPAKAVSDASATTTFTTFERWTLIIQAIGTLLVVVSLIFIAYQTQQTAQLAKRQAYEGGSGQMAAIDNIFVEHPELYPYFYEGKVIAQNDPEYVKVLTVAMAVTNFLEATLPREGADPMPWWGKYMSDQFASSPIMCEYLERRNDWFDPRLVKIMREAKGRTNSPHTPGAAGPPINEGKQAKEVSQP